MNYNTIGTSVYIDLIISIVITILGYGMTFAFKFMTLSIDDFKKLKIESVKYPYGLDLLIISFIIYLTFYIMIRTGDDINLNTALIKNIDMCVIYPVITLFFGIASSLTVSWIGRKLPNRKDLNFFGIWVPLLFGISSFTMLISFILRINLIIN
jgi:hypothetical protein